MKKTAFTKTAIATAALLGAFAAQAQVGLYGNLDVGVTRAEGVTKVESGVRSDSFVGIKAGEDLGSGLKVGVKMEGSVATDAGQNLSFDRETSIALKTGDLTVKAGQLETIASAQAGEFSPFGPMGGEFKANTVAAEYGMSGLSLSAQYTPDETAANKSDVAFGAKYKLGATTVAYSLLDTDAAGKTQLASAAHNFGAFEGFASYTKGTNADLQDGYSVGVKAPLGAMTVAASYGELDKTSTGTVKTTAVAVDYHLSKHTALYGVAANEKATGTSTDTYGFGIKHSF